MTTAIPQIAHSRRFLTADNVREEQVQTVWEAIALHTTRGVTRYMRSEVALLNSAVGLDALGTGFDQFPSDSRDAIVATERRADVELVGDGGRSRRGATS